MGSRPADTMTALSKAVEAAEKRKNFLTARTLATATLVSLSEVRPQKPPLDFVTALRCGLPLQVPDFNYLA